MLHRAARSVSFDYYIDIQLQGDQKRKREREIEEAQKVEKRNEKHKSQA